jgi:hypothetical protein
MNYDEQVLGVYNSQHPATQKETEQEEFDSANLQECLDYTKDTKDFEWIETAIIKQNVAIEKSLKELDFLIGVCEQTNNSYVKNRLKAIKRELTFNQK